MDVDVLQPPGTNDDNDAACSITSISKRGITLRYSLYMVGHLALPGSLTTQHVRDKSTDREKFSMYSVESLLIHLILNLLNRHLSSWVQCHLEDGMQWFRFLFSCWHLQRAAFIHSTWQVDVLPVARQSQREILGSNKVRQHFYAWPWNQDEKIFGGLGPWNNHSHP